MFNKDKGIANSEKGGLVFEIRDLVQDEPVVPQFCCKTFSTPLHQMVIYLIRLNALFFLQLTGE